MKFLADENLPQTIIRHIASKGYDIIDVKRAEIRGVSDIQIAEKASRDNRIIVTYDKDFLEMGEGDEGASVIVIDFPHTKPIQIIPWIDALLRRLDSDKPRKTFRLVLRKDSIELHT